MSAVRDVVKSYRWLYLPYAAEKTLEAANLQISVDDIAVSAVRNTMHSGINFNRYTKLNQITG